MTAKEKRNGKPWIPYVRVSSVGKRKDKLISPEIQLEAIAAKAAAMAVALTAPIVDLDKSGHDVKRRPDFRAMIERIQRGEAGGMIVYRLDRFSRHAADAGHIVDEIGFALATCEGFDVDGSTPTGRYMLRQLFSNAELEWDVKAEGLADVKRSAVLRGVPVRKYVPVGYAQGEDRRLVLGADAPVVLEAFKLRAAGHSVRAIADHFQDHHVRTAAGSTPWSPQTVADLLRDRIYVGELRVLDVVNVSAHDAIITEELFGGVQRVKVATSITSRNHDSAEYLLSGTVLRCAGCGYGLRPTVHRGVRTYRHSMHGRACEAKAPQTAASLIEPRVLETFWEIMGDVEAHAVEDGHDDLQARELAQTKADEAKTRLQRAAKLALDDPDLDELVETERRARDDAAAELATIEDRIASHARNSTLDVTTLRAEWERMGNDDRRKMVGEVIDCIALGRTQIAIFPSGHGPVDLPRRGQGRNDGLHPIDLNDLPAAVRVLAR